MSNQIKQTTHTDLEEIKVFSTFEEMELNENLLRGIYTYGFEKPSTIQQKAIVPIIKGNDCIAQSIVLSLKEQADVILRHNEKHYQIFYCDINRLVKSIYDSNANPNK